MRLPFTPGLVTTTHFDAECAQLADRHYTRRKKSIGKRQFSTCTRKLVLRDSPGLVVFVWTYPLPGTRWDGQYGYCCPLFRNESERLSSEIILEAEEWAARNWDGLKRMFTYVDPRKVASANPGYCFKVAGWKKMGESKDGKHLLVKG